jgi:DNA-binding NarL/FixJ family response regulator
LIAAHRVAHRLGARSLVEQVETLATRAGVALPRPEPAGREVSRPDDGGREVSRPDDAGRSDRADPLSVLTERERAVLTGLAEGRTNRQIARVLFISEKTVSVHVSHILTKLNVQSRVQAAMYLHRLEQPPDQDDLR